MRFLHTADWHLGRILGNHSLLNDQAHVLDQFVRLAGETKPDAIVIAGDLYDRAFPPAEAVGLLSQTLTRLARDFRIPVIAIGGNHDSQERLDFGTSFFRDTGLHLFGTVASAGVVTVGDTHFAALPFAEPAAVRSAFPEYEGTDHSSALRFMLDRIRPTSGRTVAIAHAFVAGGAESDSERTLSVGTAGQVSPAVFEGCCYAALGHLHRPQTLGVARYSGSLLKYSTSEAGHCKTVSLVDLDAGSVEEIALCPRRELRCVEGAFDDLLAGDASEDYLYFTLSDSGLIPDAANRLRQRYPNLIGLAPRCSSGSGEPGEGSCAAVTPLEMFSSFWRYVEGEPSEAHQKVVAGILERQQ